MSSDEDIYAKHSSMVGLSDLGHGYVKKKSLLNVFES